MYKREDFRERLLFAVPYWWQDIREMRNIQDQSATELGKYAVEFKRYVDGRSPITADSLRLMKWEWMYRIRPDLDKPLEDRRSLVLAKTRGYGIVTPERIRRTAESFKYGEVSVSENAGRVIVTFTSLYGVPPFLNDIKRALRDLIPAHLEIEYRFLYNTYTDVYEAVSSYDTLTGLGLSYTELLTTDLVNGGDGSGGSGEPIEFYDHLNGTEIRNMTPLEQRIRVRQPLQAGASSLVIGPHAFEEGTFLTIYDNANQEDVEVLIVNGDTLSVTPLSHTYARGAIIGRSSAIRQDGLGFDAWTVYTVRFREVE